MPISKIKQVQGNGTQESNGQTYYKYVYTMEDGQTLTARHQSPDKYKVGDEVEYTIKGTGQYGAWGAVGNPQNKPQQSRGASKGNNASFALSYAKDTVVGLGITRQMTEEDIGVSVTKLADHYLDWLNKNS